MENQDLEVLTECSSGCEMAIKSIEQVMDYTKDANLQDVLSKYNQKHKDLDQEITEALHEDGETAKEPNIIATAMAWTNIEMKMLLNADNHQIAKVMMDGCNMGIQKTSETINKYPNVEKHTEKLAKDLVRIEENFMEDLKVFI